MKLPLSLSILFVLFVSCTPPPATTSAPRYTLHFASHLVFRLDTQTGETWLLSTTDRRWHPITEADWHAAFSNELTAYTNLLKSLDTP